MTQNINQFNQTPEPGDLDLQFPGQVISGAVDVNLSTPLVNAQAVKFVDVAGGVPKFTALTANTDKTAGFVVRNLKDINFAAQDPFELAISQSVMFMTTSGAIARGAGVEVVYTTNTIITTGGTNPVVGIALDKAAATGAVIRVMLKTVL